MKLSEINLNVKARVISIDKNCKHAQRLIEIGFSNGTVVQGILKGLNGKLTAYSVKNTVIALRDETAGMINVLLISDGSDER